MLWRQPPGMPAGKTKRLQASWVTALENSRALLRIQFTAFFDVPLPIPALISPHSPAHLRGYSRPGGARLFAGVGAGVGPHRQNLDLPQVVHVHHGHVHPRPGAQGVHCGLGTHLPRTGHGRVRDTTERGSRDESMHHSSERAFACRHQCGTG
jgi:hypothetical protein